jgi:hypothetical protein
VCGASKIEVYENGVGAINLPPMTGMLVGGRCSRASHPEFLRRMTALVTHIGERPITLELPFREKTKGELVRSLSEDRLEDVANSTVSCVHFPRRVSGPAKQCGVCGACIERRQAMITAGISEPAIGYQYDLFGTRQVVDQIPIGELHYLKATLMQISDLNELALHEPLPDRIRRHLLGTRIVQKGESAAPWISPLLRYRDEWLSLIADAQSVGLRWSGWLGLHNSAS